MMVEHQAEHRRTGSFRAYEQEPLSNIGGMAGIVLLRIRSVHTISVDIAQCPQAFADSLVHVLRRLIGRRGTRAVALVGCEF